VFLIKSIKNFREIKKKIEFYFIIKKLSMSEVQDSKTEVCFLHSDAWNAFCDKNGIKPGTYARNPNYYRSYGRNRDHQISEEQFHLLIQEWVNAYSENNEWKKYLNTLMPIAE